MQDHVNQKNRSAPTKLPRTAKRAPRDDSEKAPANELPWSDGPKNRDAKTIQNRAPESGQSCRSMSTEVRAPCATCNSLAMFSQHGTRQASKTHVTSATAQFRERNAHETYARAQFGTRQEAPICKVRTPLDAFRPCRNGGKVSFSICRWHHLGPKGRMCTPTIKSQVLQKQAPAKGGLIQVGSWEKEILPPSFLPSFLPSHCRPSP